MRQSFKEMPSAFLLEFAKAILLVLRNFLQIKRTMTFWAMVLFYSSSV